MTKIKIKDGFPGQRLVVYPFYTINAALQNPITSGLVVHSMGYFLHAEGHLSYGRYWPHKGYATAEDDVDG